MTVDAPARHSCKHCPGERPLTLRRVPGADGAWYEEWYCTDATCGYLVAERDLRPEREDFLGASVEQLMQAPITPAGGGSSGGRGRKTEKPGERDKRLRIQRRLEDAEPLGKADATGAELGCGRGARVVSWRVDDLDAKKLDALVEIYGSLAAVLRRSLDAFVAQELGRQEEEQ